MNRSGKWLVAFVAAATVACVLGCGKARRAPPEGSPEPGKETEADIDGGRLDLFRVLPAGANRELPDRTGGRPLRMIREGNVWIVRDVVPLSGEAPTFLAWPESTFGERIVQVLYSVSRREAGDSSEGAQPPRQDIRHASYDDESKRWFVSVDELVGAAAGDVGPGRTHCLRLELYFESGRFRRFDIEFQAIGPVPVLALEGGDVVTAGDVTRWLAVAASVGPVAYQRVIRNPTKRALRAWIRVRDARPVWLAVGTTQVYHHGGPPQEARAPRTQTGTFRLARLEWSEEGKPGSGGALEEGAWVPIDLPPERAVAVRLRAESTDWRRCDWPAPSERVFHWNETERRCQREYSEGGHGSHVVCWDASVPREGRRTDYWENSGIRLSSEFRLDLKVADPSVSAETIESRGDDDWLRTVARGAEVRAVEGAGAEPSGPSGTGCEFGYL